jgi:predicted metalloprotease with PDZ domain
VLAIGPGYDLMNDAVYPELLGLASHELFHAWNVKAIRPVEMMPYDYTKENYSPLGYVCEGVTTYYGDLFLLRSAVFSEKVYFQTFNQQLQKHFDNPGRFNLSVAASSVDTWLDGYQEGIPARKTSIYTEGCLIAFLTDCAIRRQSNNMHSLDTAMHMLYAEYGNKKQGYSEQEYKKTLEKISGISFETLFADYINGTHNYEPLLKDALNYLGLELIKRPSKLECENSFGFKVVQNGSARITNVWPDSVAETSGLCKEDELVSINGMKIQNSFHDWMLFFKGQPIDLILFRQGKMLNKKLPVSSEKYYAKYSIAKTDNPSRDQDAAFKCWSK